MATHRLPTATLLEALAGDDIGRSAPGSAAVAAAPAATATEADQAQFARASCACPSPVRTDGGATSAGAPPATGGEALAVVRESLRLLAGTPAAARMRLHPVKSGVVAAWLQHAEAMACPPSDSGQEGRPRPACCEPWPQASVPWTWAITALDRMPMDDPLWACKIALQLAAISPGASRPATPRTANLHHHQQLCGEWADPLDALAALPPPFGGAAREFRAQLDHQLRRGTSAAVIERLFAANALLSPAERPMACWIPCLLGLEAWRRNGMTAPCAAPLLDFIGEHAKHQLSKLPPGIATTWLVGRDPHARCAARLLALLFMRRGLSATPGTPTCRRNSGATWWSASARQERAAIRRRIAWARPTSSPRRSRTMNSPARHRCGDLEERGLRSPPPPPPPPPHRTPSFSGRPPTAHRPPPTTTIVPEAAMPKEIIRKFEKEYGKKHGKEVFYATANKEGRDPETFRKGRKGRKAPAAKRTSAK